jgi:hypothetical protein
MILINTRFRRRPSRFPGQPVRVASQDPLPRAKGSGGQSETIQTAVGHGGRHFAPHDAQHHASRSTSDGRRPSLLTANPCPSFRTSILPAAAVQPACGPASSLMNTLAVMRGRTVHCKAFTSVNTLFLVCRSRLRAGRGYCGNRPPPEQAQLNSTSTAEYES